MKTNLDKLREEIEKKYRLKWDVRYNTNVWWTKLIDECFDKYGEAIKKDIDDLPTFKWIEDRVVGKIRRYYTSTQFREKIKQLLEGANK